MLIAHPDVSSRRARAPRRATVPGLAAVVDLLEREVREAGPGSRPVVDGLVEIMISYVLREWFARQPAGSSPDWATALADSLVGDALARIHDAPRRPWTVATLAAESSLSRAAFARRFTALVGEPPLAYLTRWRLTRAQERLRNSDAVIATIAAEVGYSSPYVFGKAFKRVTGVSPGRYREAHRAASALPAVAGE